MEELLLLLSLMLMYKLLVMMDLMVNKQMEVLMIMYTCIMIVLLLESLLM